MMVGAALVAVTVPQASGAAPAGGCSLEPTAGTVARSLGDRTYDLNVPRAFPALRSHCCSASTATANPSASTSGRPGGRPSAAEHGFIVVFPQGVDRRWDFGSGSPDVAWLREVVADVSAGWCVDPHRVYAEGYSNGAMMVERLACDMPDVIAAVAASRRGQPGWAR